MKLNRWIKGILVAVGMISLAACSHHKANQGAVNEANAAYNGEAHASGLGDESRFAEGGGHGLSKRVYYFDYDSNVVHDEDRPAIEANAEYLASHPGAKVLHEGHTDPRGSREYNIGLGE